MYFPQGPYWMKGRCSFCLEWGLTKRGEVVTCKAKGCLQKSCTDCDAINSCSHCALPFCRDHIPRDAHDCQGARSAVPKCLECKESKANLGQDHRCEHCMGPACFNLECKTQLLTCHGYQSARRMMASPTRSMTESINQSLSQLGGGCRRDVCQKCGSWHHDELGNKRFLCKECAGLLGYGDKKPKATGRSRSRSRRTLRQP